MDGEHFLARSPSRVARLINKMRDKRYRDSYVASHTRQFLARQMRAFRGDQSQAEFGKILDVPQSVISQRYENPSHGKWNVQSLFDIAARLNVAVLVRFVDFDTFIKLTDDMSEDAIRPATYEEKPPELKSGLIGGTLFQHPRSWTAMLSDKFRQKRPFRAAIPAGIGEVAPIFDMVGSTTGGPSTQANPISISGGVEMDGGLVQQTLPLLVPLIRPAAQDAQLGGMNG
jgi:hypothetical protein